MNRVHLTPQQLAFMDTFGYLAFPGLLTDCIDRIIEEFEAVFAAHGGGHAGADHDGKSRSCIVPFIDQSEYLSSLIDDPRINGIFTDLLGEDYNYLGSDGNFYVDDTNWHSDTDWSGVRRGKPPRIFYKLALYLEPLTGNNGSIRVIPGSHRWGDDFAEALQGTVRNSQDTLGIHGAEVPAIALETVPGDVSFLIRISNIAPGVGGRGDACLRSTAPPATMIVTYPFCAMRSVLLPAFGSTRSMVRP